MSVYVPIYLTKYSTKADLSCNCIPARTQGTYDHYTDRYNQRQPVKVNFSDSHCTDDYKVQIPDSEPFPFPSKEKSCSKIKKNAIVSTITTNEKMRKNILSSALMNRDHVIVSQRVFCKSELFTEEVLFSCSAISCFLTLVWKSLNSSSSLCCLGRVRDNFPFDSQHIFDCILSTTLTSLTAAFEHGLLSSLWCRWVTIMIVQNMQALYPNLNMRKKLISGIGLAVSGMLDATTTINTVYDNKTVTANEIRSPASTGIKNTKTLRYPIMSTGRIIFVNVKLHLRCKRIGKKAPFRFVAPTLRTHGFNVRYSHLPSSSKTLDEFIGARPIETVSFKPFCEKYVLKWHK